MWQSSPLHSALKEEQYHSLWRGPTGGKGDFGAPGARAYRALLKKDAGNVEGVLGLARSLLTDVQLRQPGQPQAGAPADMAALAKRNLAEAASALEPLAAQEPRAAVLLGEVHMQQGDSKTARLQFEAAGGDPVAAVGLSRLAAAEDDIATALRHSAAAIRLLPGSTPVAQLHAANLIRGKKPDEARALLTRLAELDPVDPLTFHLLSLAAREPAERDRWAATAKALLAQTTPPATLNAELDWLGWKKAEAKETP